MFNYSRKVKWLKLIVIIIELFIIGDTIHSLSRDSAAFIMNCAAISAVDIRRQ